MIKVQTLLCILITLYITPALSEIHFATSKSETWKAKILKLIDDVNTILPSSMERPETFIITYAKGVDPSYQTRLKFLNSQGAVDGVDRVLTIGDDPEAVFVHEYGHVILDQFFRQYSKAWHHFLISQHVFHNPIQDSIISYQETISDLEENLKERQNQLLQKPDDQYTQKIIKNTQKSIKRYKGLIKKLYSALEIEKEFLFTLNSSTSFHSLLPFGELFADAIAALYFEDWNTMSKALLTLYQRPHGMRGIALPPAETKEESIAMLTGQRNFNEGNDLETYNFVHWHHRSPYEQLAPTRSKIRSLKDVNGLNTEQLIEVLATAILNEYNETLVPFSAIDERTLYEKNKSLIQRLTDLTQPH